MGWSENQTSNDGNGGRIADIHAQQSKDDCGWDVQNGDESNPGIFRF